MNLPRRELTALNPFFDFDRALSNRYRASQPKAVQPAMNLFEQNDGYLILLDMPGVDKTQVEISWQDNMLSVKAERHFNVPEACQALRKEVTDLPYLRQLEFTTEVDAAAITATYNEGVLAITVPKKAEEIKQPQRIVIQ